MATGMYVHIKQPIPPSDINTICYVTIATYQNHLLIPLYVPLPFYVCSNPHVIPLLLPPPIVSPPHVLPLKNS